MGSEVDFLPANKHQSFLRDDGITLGMYITRHAQSTQNNKFPISLQNLKDNVKDEVDILPADKRQRFLQIDTVILGVCGQICQNYQKQQVCYFFPIFFERGE